MGVGGDQRFCSDRVRFISSDEDVKWALRYMSLEFSGRIRIEDTNMGVNVKMIITGTKLRLWMGRVQGHRDAERLSKKPPAKDTKKATLERGEKPEECGGHINKEKNTL